jgi:hypothetical protein
MLMISSTRVVCCTGRSAGFSPLPAQQQADDEQ